MRTLVIATVRVTMSRGAEWGHGRSAATTRAKPDRRGRWKSRGGQRDDQRCTIGGEPLSVWKHGVRERGAGREAGGEAAARAMR